MGMQSLYDIKEMLCKEIDELGARGQMSAGDLETIHKLTDTYKNILKIDMMEDGDYSEAGGDWRAEGSYARGRGNSYGRHYVRGHYSRDDGKYAMMDRMQEMMNSGQYSEAERSTLRRAMDIMNK